MIKEFVKVDATFEPDGTITPTAIYFDNKIYHIQNIIDKRLSSSELGEGGMRYAIVIEGQSTKIYLDRRSRWFVIKSNKKN